MRGTSLRSVPLDQVHQRPQRPHIGAMQHLDLSDNEAAALTSELLNIIVENYRCPRHHRARSVPKDLSVKRRTSSRVVIKLQSNRTMVAFLPPVIRPQGNATMVRLPAWDTPAWRLARELRPLYAAVNRVRDLEATPGASLEEIAAARRAIAAAAAELTRLVDAMRLFEAGRATVPYFGRS
jgi:hypothetical protein